MIKTCEYCKHKFNARRETMRFCSKECVWGNKGNNLRNKKFGDWTVLNQDPKSTKKGYFWMCRCVCGKEKFVCGYDLRKGVTKSCGCANKLPKGESACRFIFNMYKRQAISRGHVFDLTLDQFKEITKGDCFYCGSEPSNKCDRLSSNSNGVFIYNGIDRRDNLKGYILSNVVPCCKICNSMKSKLSETEFFDHINKILEFSRR